MIKHSEIDGQINDLQQRLTSIVRSHCNAIGCDNCDLKFGGFDSRECSATDLDGRIFELEMKRYS